MLPIRQPSIRKHLDGFVNLRDLGGIIAGDGRVSIYNRYLRSDAPTHLSATSVVALSDLPLSLSIDLRTADERQKDPSILAGVPGIRELHLPMISDAGLKAFIDRTDPKTVGILGDLYIHLIDHHVSGFIRVLEAMADLPFDSGAILFHCAQGKDRTGLIAAAIQLLAGVSDADIVAHYQVSYTYLRPLVDPLMAQYPADMKQLLRSDYWNMEKWLMHIRGHIGALDRYLIQNGLSADAVHILTDRLCKPAESRI